MRKLCQFSLFSTYLVISVNILTISGQNSAETNGTQQPIVVTCNICNATRNATASAITTTTTETSNVVTSGVEYVEEEIVKNEKNNTDNEKVETTTVSDVEEAVEDDQVTSSSNATTPESNEELPSSPSNSTNNQNDDSIAVTNNTNSTTSTTTSTTITTTALSSNTEEIGNATTASSTTTASSASNDNSTSSNFETVTASVDDNVTSNSLQIETTTTTEELGLEDVTDGEDSTGEGEITDEKCFDSIKNWQVNLLRRIITTRDNVRFQLHPSNPSTLKRKELFRRGLHNLMTIRRIVESVDFEKDSEDEAMEVMTKSERNFNRIGLMLYREPMERKQWKNKECCYKNTRVACGERSTQRE